MGFLARRKNRPPKAKKSRCVFEACECRGDPANRELIHRRDAVIESARDVPGLRRVFELRLEEAILELQLDFARGDIDSVELLEERIEVETDYWSKRDF